MFGVRGIPILINTGEVVTRDGRQEVMSLGVSALATWSQAAPQHVDTSVVSMLADNTDDVMEAAKEILVKMLGNIINDPNNTKYRAVKMSNKVIIEKLLPASGAFEILFSVGFEEADDKLILPLGADLRVIKQFRDSISELSKGPPPATQTSVASSSGPTSEPSSSISAAPSSSRSSNIVVNNIKTNEAEFLAKLSSCMSHVDAFENP